MGEAEPRAYYAAQLQEPEGLEPFHLNGTQDMLETFDLMPLYDRAVRPYLKPETTGGPSAGEPPKRAALPKTYVHYVEDLPGKVRPPKRSGATRHQRELSQLMMKPEYTYTPIVPFDDETLQSAFHVEPSAGPTPGIDLSMLEADEQEPPSEGKKRHTSGEQTGAGAPPRKRVVLISKKKQGRQSPS